MSLFLYDLSYVIKSCVNCNVKFFLLSLNKLIYFIKDFKTFLNEFQNFWYFSYAETARVLERETNLDLRRYDVCDNIDLDTVLQEYESYYYVRFNRYPKVTKKVTNSSI